MILFYPVQGCETKDAKLVRMCLALMQRLVTNKVIDFKGARYITDTLWMLMEAGIEVIIFNTHNTILLRERHNIDSSPRQRPGNV